MIWGKRRFQDAEFGPYQDRLDKLAMASGATSNKYVMVSTENEAGEEDYYVGVPDEISMRLFDGFTRINESDLPKEIDFLHLDAGSGEVERLFKFKKADL